jgi:hypothetical protein
VSWKTLPNPMLPWVRTLDKIMASVRPEPLMGKTMLVASDYGGLHPKSRYRVDAYFCADLESLMEWERKRRQIRRELLSDGRRLSYKGLNDKVRARALVPFLSSVLRIPGLLLVTITSRQLRNLCFDDEISARLTAEQVLRARWKRGQLGEAARVAHTVACLVGGMSRPGQDVYWISDEDSMLSNDAQSRDLARLLSAFTSLYVPHALGELGIGTTKLDEGDRWEEDIASVADIAAGGVADVINSLSASCGGRLPTNLAIEHKGALTDKAALLADWFWLARGSLTRVAVVFESMPNNQYAVFKTTMHSEE